MNANAAPTAVQVVEDFFAAIGGADVDRAMEHLAPDVVWQNTGLPTLRGLPAVRRAFELANRPTLRFGVEMQNIASEGETVLTERIDTLYAGPLRSRFWVCGTFELRDGRIVLWRDRFSWGNFAAGTVRATARSLLRR
ncbi:limonene-1,2-epoxide hydrolase family protein [Prescottella agglutinans]|uniref:Limonene-1,2-epoxide hydrolase n=1 Tax=Prescottella agglutinans TaxID=1644129 RepID=A0ABT6MGS7_9NOCA|nr:limonene-1,2-epoxide hydrolase family protein [Prescottella agglutinans]MDH6283519.1 limonene-1,2-epoxide hydrolase [Prescottella agglutinans]